MKVVQYDNAISRFNEFPQEMHPNETCTAGN
jgi:hypothetical protein